MLWKKKKMVDIRELQRKGIIRIPRNNIEVPTDKDGFVELNKKPKTKTTIASSSDSSSAPTSAFNFFNSEPQSQFSSETEGYNKREVDAKIETMDNKIYKLEQRIELLERKLGITQEVSSGINW